MATARSELHRLVLQVPQRRQSRSRDPGLRAGGAGKWRSERKPHQPSTQLPPLHHLSHQCRGEKVHLLPRLQDSLHVRNKAVSSTPTRPQSGFMTDAELREHDHHGGSGTSHELEHTGHAFPPTNTHRGQPCLQPPPHHHAAWGPP